MKYLMALIVIVILSIITIVVFPLDIAYESVIVVPGSLSLIAALFQILRDESSFQKTKSERILIADTFDDYDRDTVLTTQVFFSLSSSAHFPLQITE